jgi:hypothetical protein
MVGQEAWFVRPLDMPRPAQQSKRTSNWVKVFQDAVLGHAEFMSIDSRVANRHFDRSIEAWRALTQQGDAGLSALGELLGHESTDVRVTTATYLLPYRTADALRVLTSAREAGDPLALVTLARWARGFYIDPLTNREVTHDTTVA